MDTTEIIIIIQTIIGILIWLIFTLFTFGRQEFSSILSTKSQNIIIILFFTLIIVYLVLQYIYGINMFNLKYI